MIAISSIEENGGNSMRFIAEVKEKFEEEKIANDNSLNRVFKLKKNKVITFFLNYLETQDETSSLLRKLTLKQLLAKRKEYPVESR